MLFVGCVELEFGGCLYCIEGRIEGFDGLEKRKFIFYWVDEESFILDLNFKGYGDIFRFYDK